MRTSAEVWNEGARSLVNLRNYTCSRKMKLPFLLSDYIKRRLVIIFLCWRTYVCVRNYAFNYDVTININEFLNSRLLSMQIEPPLQISGSATVYLSPKIWCKHCKQTLLLTQLIWSPYFQSNTSFRNQRRMRTVQGMQCHGLRTLDKKSSVGLTGSSDAAFFSERACP